jgi:capsular exopolysaccharide synthesis family protein
MDVASLDLPSYILSVLRRRVRLITVIALGLAGAVLGLSFMLTPRYEASIKIFVGQESGSGAPVDVFALQQLTQTVVEAVNTRPVANDVIQRLDLSMSPNTLLDNLQAEQIKASQFVELTYTDTDAQRAQLVANASGEALSDRMSAIDTGDTDLSATVWESARLPADPVSPKPVRNGVVALIAGVLFGTMLAFLREYLDESWRSPDELESISGKPNLGMIPKAEPSAARTRKLKQQNEAGGIADDLVTLGDPAGLPAEAYRTLRTNLLFAYVDNAPRAIVVSSVGAREGKSSICANLATVLAQAENRTLIVDCDLRHPSMHKIFGVHNSFGMVDVVAGQRKWQEVLHEPLQGLMVMTAGTLPPDPATLLGSEHFVELLAQVNQAFDYVLLDTAPIATASDATIIAHQGDGILLVVDAQSTRKWGLRQSIRSLETVEANLLGTVMNRVESNENVNYYDKRRTMRG